MSSQSFTKAGKRKIRKPTTLPAICILEKLNATAGKNNCFDLRYLPLSLVNDKFTRKMPFVSSTNSRKILEKWIFADIEKFNRDGTKNSNPCSRG